MGNGLDANYHQISSTRSNIPVMQREGGDSGCGGRAAGGADAQLSEADEAVLQQLRASSFGDYKKPGLYCRNRGSKSTDARATCQRTYTSGR